MAKTEQPLATRRTYPIESAFPEECKLVLPLFVKDIDIPVVYEWVNNNTTEKVHIVRCVVEPTYEDGKYVLCNEGQISMQFIGFENLDDALVYKIKYSI